ncbi:class I SAM-dependent methyltransferase, partial [Candidatus Woesearchaeota archaeon]|nr:class I SAM-dependent methyltransferase [Candidatus Woesearchaeota archaeon]
MEQNTKQVAAAYDQFGKWYHKYRKSKNFFNSKIDMPAVLSFLKNVKGKKIIDIGCGSGLYTKILRKRGAKMCGMDISKTLLEIAKKENPGVDFQLASIHKIPFKKNTFDIAISALMLDYVKDWDSAFKEVRRVLKPNGIYIFSLGNPLLECREKIKFGSKVYRILGYTSGSHSHVFGDYFKERWQETMWKTEEGESKMAFKTHHKTYDTIINTILRNGFTIEGYKDAKPIPSGKK